MRQAVLLIQSDFVGVLSRQISVEFDNLVHGLLGRQQDDINGYFRHGFAPTLHPNNPWFDTTGFKLKVRAGTRKILATGVWTGILVDDARGRTFLFFVGLASQKTFGVSDTSRT